MRDEHCFIESIKGNYYLVVAKENLIIPIHPIIKKFYDLEVLGKLDESILLDRLCSVDDQYHFKQYQFFKSKGWFYDQNRKLSTDLGRENVINKLANIKQILFEVTDACNLNCHYCGYGELYGNYDVRKDRNLDFITAKTLIDYLWGFWSSDYNVSFNNTITLGFYGGEPLLNMKLIKEIISYVNYKKSWRC